MSRPSRRRSGAWWVLAIAGALAAAAPARAVPFSLALAPPSAIGGVPLAGSLALDVASIPVAAPAVLRLTDVSASGGGAAIALDESVLSPGLGVVQPDGSFLIPTLFLRVDHGSGPFDLAIPNVTGTLVFGTSGGVVGLASSFDIDTGSGIVTAVVAAVPEPGTALLLASGLAALARRRIA